MAAGGFPQVITEVAFTTDPFSPPFWTDISPYVEEVSITRGRQRERQAVETGVLGVTLRNEDRRFEPEYAASPYYPNVVPNRAIRQRAVFNSIAYPLFRGFVDRWPVEWSDFNRGLVKVTASDAFKVFAHQNLQQSRWVEEINKDLEFYPAFVWYRLGDSLAATLAGAAVGGPPGTAENVAFAADGLIQGDEDGAAQFNGANSRIVYSAPDANFTSLIEFVFDPDDAGQGAGTPMLWQGSDSTYISFVGTTLTAKVDHQTGVATLTAAGIDITKPHHVALVLGDGTNARLYVDRVLIQSAALSVYGIRMGDSFSIGGPIPGVAGAFFKGVIDEFVHWKGATLPAARIQAHSDAALLGLPVELSGARLNRILDYAGWPAADRSIDAGNSTFGAGDFGGSVLEYLQKIQESEDGLIYVTDDGLIRFVQRHAFLKSPYTTSQATFVDQGSGAGLPYEGLVPDYDEANIVNEARYSREGGPTITVVDAVSKDRYLSWQDERSGLLLSDELQVADFAGWVVAHKKDPALEFRSLALRPMADDLLWPQVLGRELGDLVTVKRTPPTGATLTRTARIEKIVHSFAPVKAWKTDYQLSPVTVQAYWELGVAQLGVSTRLAF